MRRDAFAAVAVAAALFSVGSVATAPADDDDNEHRRPRNVFRARLSPTNEVPTCSSTGSGSAVLTIDDEAQSIAFRVSYELGGTTTVAHVHLGQPFASGGVSFFMCGGAPPASNKPACPPSPATIEGTVVAADVIGPANQGIAAGEFAEIVAAIRAGRAYANVHSSICPAGEVRGQLR